MELMQYFKENMPGVKVSERRCTWGIIESLVISNVPKEGSENFFLDFVKLYLTQEGYVPKDTSLLAFWKEGVGNMLPNITYSGALKKCFIDLIGFPIEFNTN